jgi:hypothetical protein
MMKKGALIMARFIDLSWALHEQESLSKKLKDEDFA